jgi:hypothetical protein
VDCQYYNAQFNRLEDDVMKANHFDDQLKAEEVAGRLNHESKVKTLRATYQLE